MVRTDDQQLFSSSRYPGSSSPPGYRPFHTREDSIGGTRRSGLSQDWSSGGVSAGGLRRLPGRLPAPFHLGARLRMRLHNAKRLASAGAENEPHSDRLGGTVEKE